MVSVRRGRTLAELLVILVIGALIVLVGLPLVLGRRENSRRATCQDRLSQLGQAAQDFADTQARIPSAHWYSEIMAYPESRFYDERVAKKELPNRYFEVLICPSDTGPFLSDSGLYTNYLGTEGVWSLLPERVGPIQFVRPDSAPGITWDAITDGTEATALFSETQRAGRARLRTIWSLPGPPFQAQQLDEFAETIGRLPQDPSAHKFVGHPGTKGLIIGQSFFNGGTTFYAAGLGRSTYNHGGAPQSPSCHNGNIIPESLISASSEHRVVNVVFCDGHVEAITPDIALPIWRALGSRQADD